MNVKRDCQKKKKPSEESKLDVRTNHTYCQEEERRHSQEKQNLRKELNKGFCRAVRKDKKQHYNSIRKDVEDKNRHRGTRNVSAKFSEL